MQWTSSSREGFQIDGGTPTATRALGQHCAWCGFAVPAGLRDDLASRIACDAPGLTEWGPPCDVRGVRICIIGLLGYEPRQ